MPTVALTVREYNEARIRAALAVHQEVVPRNGNPRPIGRHRAP
jgi:hypothetical protein